MAVQLQPFPSTNSPAGEGSSEPMANIWFYLFRTMWNRLGGSGSTLVTSTITVGVSTFVYSTDISGTVVVRGGTVSEISIVRGTDNIVTGVTAGPIPLLRGDSIAVTYSVAPTMTFLPSEFVQTAT